MLAGNIKIKTHVQHFRDHAATDSRTRNKLVLYGFATLSYCLMAAYLGVRGWQAFGSQLNLPLYIIGLAALALVLPVAAYLLDQGREARPFPKVIAYAGFYWTAFFLYAVLLMLGIDLLRFMEEIIDPQLVGLLPTILPFSLQKALYFVVFTTLFILAIGTFLARWPRITGYLLSVDKDLARTRPLRIALLSDIHYGSLVSTANLKQMCSKVEAQQPDLILLAGDLIDNSLQLLRRTDFVAQMSSLRAPLGVFAVLGNHELVNADQAETVSFFRSAGIRVLMDEAVDLDGQVTLVGRNERKKKASGLEQQMRPGQLLAQADQDKLVILMQHQPVDLDEFDRAGVDLAVAGHTHRGQLFPLNLLNRHKFAQSRRYYHLSQLHSIISSGYGTWGPPIRLGSRSEIVIIDLVGRRPE